MAAHLLRSGASVFCNASQGKGFTVLHAAVKEPSKVLQGDESISASRILVAACPEYFTGESKTVLDSRDDRGLTVIQLATMRCDIPTVQLLIELGVDINVDKGTPLSPLRIALECFYFGSGRLQNLLQQGPTECIAAETIQEATESNWMASRFKHISDLLLKAGAERLDVDETTGDYTILLKKAAKLYFTFANDLGREDDGRLWPVLQEIFSRFNFVALPDCRICAGMHWIVICLDGTLDGEGAKLVFVDED